MEVVPSAKTPPSDFFPLAKALWLPRPPEPAFLLVFTPFLRSRGAAGGRANPIPAAQNAVPLSLRDSPKSSLLIPQRKRPGALRALFYLITLFAKLFYLRDEPAAKRSRGSPHPGPNKGGKTGPQLPTNTDTAPEVGGGRGAPGEDRHPPPGSRRGEPRRSGGGLRLRFPAGAEPRSRVVGGGYGGGGWCVLSPGPIP